MGAAKKHIVIDARIRRASTGRPVAKLLVQLQELDQDHRYTFVLEKSDPWKPSNPDHAVIYSRFPQFSFNLLNQLLYALQLYRLRADLVYFTLTPQQPVFYVRNQATLTHDLVMFKYARAGRLPRWLHSVRMQGYRFLMWQAHRQARLVVTPTEFVRDDVLKRYLFINRKITFIHEASDPPLAVRAKAPEHAPERFIVYVGSAFPHKNLDRLIMAFEILKEEHRDLKLVLVGKQEYHAKALQKWARVLPHYDDIVFTGFVDEAELKWYYQNARAYVFASLNEGFGLPGLEAMAHGCPVVSSNAASLTEVHGDAAVYFDPLNTQEMAAKIDEVISSEPLRNKLIAKGYENNKRFSWKRFASEHIKVFESLL